MFDGWGSRGMAMVLGIKLINDFAYKKTFGDPYNRLALISLLNAILMLDLPIVDVAIQNPYNDKDFEDDKLTILDIKAIDSSSAIYNIEMQISVCAGLVKRMVFYTCELFSAQMYEGDSYTHLNPVFSICLLNDKLWTRDETAHHRFRLEDRQSGRVLKDTIEIHLVELPKYTLDRGSLASATPIERWAFLLQNSQLYTAEELRELFLEEAFQLVISSVETIYLKTEYREMYETREKALRDYDWKINTARDEGIIKGREEGKLIGIIRTCQMILSVPQSSEESLRGKPVSELQSLADGLQSTLRKRVN